MNPALPRPELIIGLAFISIIYLVLVYVMCRRISHLEVKLISLGLLTALLAVWCGMLMGQANVSLQTQPGEMAQMTIGVEVAGILGRIAVLLVLGGFAVSILPLPSNRMEANREHLG